MVKTVLRDYCRYIIVAVACICLSCYIWYRLHDYGGGTGSVGKQVESAAAANQEHQASAERITSGVERVEGRIDEAQNGINKAADRTASSEQLIGECKQILAGIRQRGSSHPPSR